MLGELSQPDAPEERVAKGADAAKQAFDNGVANMRQLNELGAKASAEVLAVIAQRIGESFDEMRLYARPQAAAE